MPSLNNRLVYKYFSSSLFVYCHLEQGTGILFRASQKAQHSVFEAEATMSCHCRSLIRAVQKRDIYVVFYIVCILSSLDIGRGGDELFLSPAEQWVH